MDIGKARAQVAIIEEYDAIRNAISRVKDAMEQKAHVYHIEATDHALSHRSIAFEFTPIESVELFKAVGSLLKNRLKATEEKLK